MRKVIYIIWALLLVVGITLKILGIIGWGLALSPLWFPLVSFLSTIIVVVLGASLAESIKKRKEAKIPDTCGNCLFGKTCDLINASKKEGEEKEKCMGERIGGATRGVVCPYYERSND